jgi:hypothetical protein
MWEQNGNEMLRVPRYRYKWLRKKNFQGVLGENPHGAYRKARNGKLRGIRFLDFLRSGEKDIDVFVKKGARVSKE